MYLSYSGYKLYRSCPRAYYHRYLNKTPVPVPDNKVNALFGTVVGLLFEAFYAEELWRQSGTGKGLMDRAPGVLEQAIQRECREGVVDFKDPKSNYKSKEALLQDILEAVPRGLRVIKHHRFLGGDAKAEMKLDMDFGPHRIGGRADFVMTRMAPHNDLVILDGKGSKWRDKYVDSTQLVWYAMLYQRLFKRLPDRLAFVYWRFEPDQAVDWLDITQEMVDQLWSDVQYALNEITLRWGEIEVLPMSRRLPLLMEHFHAQADRGGCKLCPYVPVCTEGSYLLRSDVPTDDMDLVFGDGT